MATITVPRARFSRYPVAERRSSVEEHLRELAAAINELQAEVQTSRWHAITTQPTNPVAVDGPGPGGGSGSWVDVIPETTLRLEVRCQVRLLIPCMVLYNANNTGKNHDFQVLFETEQVHLNRQRKTTGERASEFHFVDVGSQYSGARSDGAIDPGEYSIEVQARATDDAEMDYRAVGEDSQTCLLVWTERAYP